MEHQNNKTDEKGRGASTLMRGLAPREIKFRVYDKDEGKFVDCDDWQLAGLNHFSKTRGCYEVMQFTGHTDTFGNKIYEGDIIDADYGIGIVEFDQTTKKFKYVFDIDSDDLWLYTNDCEVIGNIFENPELIP